MAAITQAQIEGLAALVTGDSHNARHPANWQVIQNFLWNLMPDALSAHFSGGTPTLVDFYNVGFNMLFLAGFPAPFGYGLDMADWIQPAVIEQISNIVTTYPYVRGTGNQNEQLAAATP